MDTRIMLIDPDPQELQKLNSRLSNTFTTLICSRLDNAFDFFCLFRPSAVVIDMTLFGERARAFAKRVRSLSYGGVPLIALTGMGTIEQVIDGLNSRFDRVYSRPCPPDRISGISLELLAKPASLDKAELVQI